MTICPIAIAVSCKKCPVFKICPVKSVLGDMPKAAETKPAPKPVAKPAAKSGSAHKKRRK